MTRVRQKHVEVTIEKPTTLRDVLLLVADNSGITWSVGINPIEELGGALDFGFFSGDGPDDHLPEIWRRELPEIVVKDRPVKDLVLMILDKADVPYCLIDIKGARSSRHRRSA